MIRYGKPAFVPGLKALWKECFADEDAYIDAFFHALYQDEHVLLEEENGVLMGASFFLPGKIDREGAGAGEHRWQDIRYVYALAVYPQYRGRGIAASLLHRAYELYKAPLIAEPANEGLIGGFYEPLGFTGNFYLKKTQMQVPAQTQKQAQGRMPSVPNDIRAAELFPMQGQSDGAGDMFQEGFLSGSCFQPVQAEQYCRIRDARLGKQGYVSWPVRHVAFAIEQHSSSGGGAYVLYIDGREELLLYYQEAQDVIVTETTLTGRELEEYFLPWITGRCSRVVFTGAAHTEGIFADAAGQAGDRAENQRYAGMVVTEVKECLTGMSYGILQMQGYLNLTLD